MTHNEKTRATRFRGTMTTSSLPPLSWFGIARLGLVQTGLGSVTVLNGHIHQIVQKVEGNITFHTARSTAYPQPAAGVGAGPGPLKVPSDDLPKMLGVSNVTLKHHPDALSLTDTTLA